MRWHHEDAFLGGADAGTLRAATQHTLPGRGGQGEKACRIKRWFLYRGRIPHPALPAKPGEKSAFREEIVSFYFPSFYSQSSSAANLGTVTWSRGNNRWHIQPHEANEKGAPKTMNNPA